MEIKLNKDELIQIISKHYRVDGDVKFIISEETYRCGYSDEGNQYSTRHKFDGVKFNTNSIDFQI